MDHPKLKHPRLCRMLTYAVVFGGGLLPVFIIASIPAPDFVRVIVISCSLTGLLVFLFRNLMVLMMMDTVLASLSCYRTARKRYTLPANRTTDDILCSVLRYGMHCDPTPIQPQPFALRYKFSSPMTVYSRGTERIVAAYEVDLLDRDTYSSIRSSAKTNSKALIGKKKSLFLAKAQKKRPLHRATVLLILAHKIDPQLIPKLYELVCKQCGDENENCIIPCVVNLEHHTCVFNCLRTPYVGLGYPVKNRGIRMIRQRVFGGNMDLRGNKYFLEPIRGIDPEKSLWDLWRDLHHQVIGADREAKQRFGSMSEHEIVLGKDLLYLKWDHRGICQTVKSDDNDLTVRVETVTNWYYPKTQPIDKKTTQKMKEHIASYYRNQGYAVEFVDKDTLV